MSASLEFTAICTNSLPPSLEAGTITNLNEDEVFDSTFIDDAVSSSRNSPTRGKPPTSRRTTRARRRASDAKSPASHPSLPRKHSLSDTFEDVGIDHLYEKVPLEYQRAQSTSTSLQRPDDFDDEPDELDLLGIPSPPMKRRTLSHVSSGAISAPGSEMSETALMRSNTANGEEDIPDGEMDEAKEESVMAEVLLSGDGGAQNDENTGSAIQTHTEEQQGGSEPQHSDSMALDFPAVDSVQLSSPFAVEDEDMVVDPNQTVERSETTTAIPVVQAVQSFDSQRERAIEPTAQEEEEHRIQYNPNAGSQAELKTNQAHRALSQSPLSSLPTFPSSPIPDKSLPLPVIITAYTPRVVSESIFNFDIALDSAPTQTTPVSPNQPRHQIQSNYSLPPLKYLPPEYNRKTRSTKLQRKREKEREKYEGRRDRDFSRDDWIPMGLNRWAATVSANPVYKRVSRASKCLSTRDWAVSITINFIILMETMLINSRLLCQKSD
jgi:hypothetical protein